MLTRLRTSCILCLHNRYGNGSEGADGQRLQSPIGLLPKKWPQRAADARHPLHGVVMSTHSTHCRPAGLSRPQVILIIVPRLNPVTTSCSCHIRSPRSISAHGALVWYHVVALKLAPRKLSAAAPLLRVRLLCVDAHVLVTNRVAFRVPYRIEPVWSILVGVVVVIPVLRDRPAHSQEMLQVRHVESMRNQLKHPYTNDAVTPVRSRGRPPFPCLPPSSLFVASK